MEQKKKAKPSDQLIKSLMDDLKEMAEPTALKTVAVENLDLSSAEVVDPDKTVALAKGDSSEHQLSHERPVSIEPKVSFGLAKPAARSSSLYPSVDLQMQHAENLRLAQSRILELEKLAEKLRGENEQLASSMEVARDRVEELSTKVRGLEKSRNENREQAAAEISVYRENSQVKDREIAKLKQKVQEMEVRLQADMKKIRVRERELENRLELAKVEKSALVRSKDETILELKRKLDQLTAELEVANEKGRTFSQQLENNQEQFSRTVRALRLALTNLEVNEDIGSITIAPFKKAE